MNPTPPRHNAALASVLRSFWHDFFNPDFIAEVCGELGVPWRSNGYRWFLPKP